MKKSWTIGFFVVIALVTTFTSVYAGIRNYYNWTTVTYTNGITDFYDLGWSPTISDWTSNPSRNMDQFGLTYWQAYCRCDGALQYGTVLESTGSWLLQNNKYSIGDGMAAIKNYCTGTTAGYNHAQHWWQDAGYSGDGATLVTHKTLTSLQ